MPLIASVARPTEPADIRCRQGKIFICSCIDCWCYLNSQSTQTLIREKTLLLIHKNDENNVAMRDDAKSF